MVTSHLSSLPPFSATKAAFAESDLRRKLGFRRGLSPGKTLYEMGSGQSVKSFDRRWGKRKQELEDGQAIKELQGDDFRTRL